MGIDWSNSGDVIRDRKYTLQAFESNKYNEDPMEMYGNGHESEEVLSSVFIN